ncbi:MAG: diaminopimelate epimerase [Bacteroidota bacterium]
MKINFFKYHGNGNDFIIIDNRSGEFYPVQEQIVFLCDRHLGIGADGLMLLENTRGYDFSLKYYNSDGNESTMCGNGGRCMTAFAHGLKIIGKKARFSAVDGDHEAEILSQNGDICMVRLKMKDTSPGTIFDDGYFIDTGSPHFVVYVKDVEAVDVQSEGRKLRYDKRFAPGGCNVNFVEIIQGGLSVRTYERGVENETLSCGTGVTASALITAFLSKDRQHACFVKTPGGEFNVNFQPSSGGFSGVFLEGPAAFVFKGGITI